VIVLIIPLVESQFLAAAAAQHSYQECEKAEGAAKPSTCYTMVSNTGHHCLVHHVQTEASQRRWDTLRRSKPPLWTAEQLIWILEKSRK